MVETATVLIEHRSSFGSCRGAIDGEPPRQPTWGLRLPEPTSPAGKRGRRIQVKDLLPDQLPDLQDEVFGIHWFVDEHLRALHALLSHLLDRLP